mmetsp:Transcript_6734/g.8358  ORF Transcript_6734/g.8358 Transcript_6734/m.8358 type:complete len:427 (-) Transcript_6734:91-1371(-)|eukprot:CAMPEP_0172515372 /NCGR_PEP_ID=MMETSP1066-20121228/267556_1 /TAXON_ID=671091 /ORGANISM="Coscinodiscus wailesii, Strain CCMP2513" /LENGTH=426 /DNA_ID=CAMNT_0013296411 /DNA_START=103 /DNA_END=1383 /DNA_ORIENTATION=+
MRLTLASSSIAASVLTVFYARNALSVTAFTPLIPSHQKKSWVKQNVFPNIYQTNHATKLFMSDSDADELRSKAEKLREEIKKMEERLDRSGRTSNVPATTNEESADESAGMSLRNKTVMVVGANGRVGSMACRYLLRNFPQTNVVAAVHFVSENSMTARGYGRLSYEVGAEDGVGNIGAAWSDERTATFEYADYMKDYNLQNLRVVEVELLDPVQCQTITQDVDCIIWAATDFDGNTPRAVAGFNPAFLFRAVAAPTKGRVEVEGLRNLLGGFKNAKQNERWKTEMRSGGVSSAGGSGGRSTASDPISFVLISASEDALSDYETPYGSFKGLKREGENMILEEFPSVSHCVLQMSRYEDNFVDENLDVLFDSDNSDSMDEEQQKSLAKQKMKRRINRRDAARAAANALIDESLMGKKVEVWTATRG